MRGVDPMKKLLIFAFTLMLLAGCAVVTPYGTEYYFPLPPITIPITVAPYPGYFYWGWPGPGVCAYGCHPRFYGPAPHGPWRRW